MKKFLAILLLFLAVVSCKMRKFDPIYYPLAEDLSMQFRSIVDRKTMSSGGAYQEKVSIAGEDRAFKQLQIRLKNDSAQDMEMNFQEMVLLDSENKEYRPIYCVQVLKMTSNVEKI